jgi:membrane protein required for beta-lactamase induction
MSPQQDHGRSSSGATILLTVGALVLLVLGGLAVRGGFVFGWVLVLLALVVGVLALRARGSGATHDRTRKLPGPDEPVYVEPPSNVRRIG